jgi:transcriptional regulator with XRE-family HTH domain
MPRPERARADTGKTPPKAAKKTNRIRQLRTRLQLSQRALAEKVGISQQHIQRLETSDDIDVGFVLAAKLCKALGAPLDMVFPRTKSIVSKLPTTEDGRLSIDPLFYDRRAKEEIEKAGIDMDVTPWFIQMKLRGHAETVDVLLADGEYSRLWRILQGETLENSFVVFDGADGYRYAVQPKHLMSWQFKFDVHDLAGMVKIDSDGKRLNDESKIPDETVRLWFSDGTPVVQLDGEVDEPDDFHDIGPLNYIFYMLELSSEDDCYSLVDSAGEPFWFKSADVALFAAPDHLIGIDDADKEDDRDQDDREGEVAGSVE